MSSWIIVRHVHDCQAKIAVMICLTEESPQSDETEEPEMAGAELANKSPLRTINDTVV